jgi:hypothetical protein
MTFRSFSKKWSNYLCNIIEEKNTLAGTGESKYQLSPQEERPLPIDLKMRKEENDGTLYGISKSWNMLISIIKVCTILTAHIA